MTDDVSNITQAIYSELNMDQTQAFNAAVAEQLEHPYIREQISDGIRELVNALMSVERNFASTYHQLIALERRPRITSFRMPNYGQTWSHIHTVRRF